MLSTLKAIFEGKRELFKWLNRSYKRPFSRYCGIKAAQSGNFFR